MKTPTLLLAVSSLAVVLSSSHAFADASLRLYRGPSPADLGEELLIDSKTGSVTDIKYQKGCGAYGGCGAVESSRSGVASLAASDLTALNVAIAKLNPNAPRGESTPGRPSVCKYFQRLSYVALKESGEVVLADFSDCKGSKLDSPEASAVLRVLDVAIDNAGL